MLAAGTAIRDDPGVKTIAVHSVVIVPEFQGRGVGKELVVAYVEYIRGLGLGFERVVLIAHDHLIRFYEGVGFVNFGIGGCLFAGGGWNDLVSSYFLFVGVCMGGADRIYGVEVGALDEKRVAYIIDSGLLIDMAINYRRKSMMADKDQSR